MTALEAVPSSSGIEATIEQSALKWLSQNMISDDAIDLKRTSNAIPLPGIDVPFHSSFLRGGIDSYR